MNDPRPKGKRLFAIPRQPRRRTSEVILELADKARDSDVSLRALTEGLGDRTFGVLLIVLAAFNVIPFVSLFSGLLVCLLGIQMTLGVPHAKLPAFVLDRKLPSAAARSALLGLSERIQRIERVIRPRWQFSEAAIVDRLNGLLLAVLGFVIALPLPFTNFLPAIIVMVMGLGLLERDGLVQFVALGFGVAAVSAIGFLILLAD